VSLVSTLAGRHIVGRLTLTALGLCTVLAAQIPAPSEAPAKLEPFEVTGSRVKRVDYELPSPITTYTVADIEAMGYATTGEFIQNLPFNSENENSELNPTGSFMPGAVTANARGLGSNRLLTLINGRRAVPFPMPYATQSLFNFNSIPLAAIERIEYLKDGASALYGSDAITGVMNIILRKSFSGASLDFFVSTPLHAGDAQTRRATVVVGGARNGWDAMLGLTRQERHASFLSDLGVKSTDYRSLGPKGSDFRSIVMPPAVVLFSAAEARAAGVGTATGYYVVNGGVPMANPTKAMFTYAGSNTASIPDANRVDLVNHIQITPASETTGLYGTLGRRVSPTVSAYGQFSYNRSAIYQEDLPLGVRPAPGNLSFPLVIGAGNPFNPFGIALPISDVPFATGSLRPRSKTTDQALTALAGLRGTLPGAWEWQASAGYGVDHAGYSADMAVPAEIAAAGVSTDRATAYNPFGDNRALMERLFRHRVGINNNLAESLGGTLSVSGKPWRLPWRGAGELGAAAGYEFRRESLEFRSHEINYAASIGGGQQSYAGQRKVHAVFGELTVPLQKWLELQLAARSERYSDFGATTRPKAGVALRLPETRLGHMMLRGSYSESFKAPDFGQLYTPQVGIFGGTPQNDPLRPQDGARTLQLIQHGNPALEPENGKVQYTGVSFDVKAVRGLSLTVDYFDIQIRNVIQRPDVAYLLSPEGLRLFPNAIVRDNGTQNPRPISYVDIAWQNLGYQLYRGWDYGLRYTSPRTRWGGFSFSADAVQVVKKGFDLRTGAGFINQTGQNSTPVWRGNARAGWYGRQVGATIAANLIGKLYNRRFTSVGWGENNYITVTPALTYRGFARTKLTLTCGNVLNHRPPANGRTIRGFDINVYGAGAMGRTLSLDVRRDF
jgi:iron complex outermembrane recepter protein